MKDLLIQLIRLDGRDSEPEDITITNCIAVFTELVNKIASCNHNGNGNGKTMTNSSAALAELISKLSVRAQEAVTQAAALSDLI